MPALDDICYKRNFLTSVIARIDLLNPVPGLDTALPEAINQVALRTFPVREPRHSVAHELQIAEREVATKQSEFMEWHFHGRQREKTLAVAPSWVYATYRRYERFEQLRAEFLEQAEAFFAQYPTAEPSRLGLRYINQVELHTGDPLDWSGYLNPAMLSIFDLVDAKPRIARAMHDLEVAEDDFQIRFQFGMHNPDYPAPIRRKLFVLDFDSYRRGHFDPRELGDLLDKFHLRVQELFEHSVMDRLRGILNAAEGT